MSLGQRQSSAAAAHAVCGYMSARLADHPEQALPRGEPMTAEVFLAGAVSASCAAPAAVTSETDACAPQERMVRVGDGLSTG